MYRKLKNVRSHIIICVALAIALNAIGLGYAAWQNGLQFEGVVATGYIDPRFSSCEVLENCSPGRAKAVLEGQGKRLALHVHDAYPGYYARFRFQVTNQGTVPVGYTARINNDTPEVDIKVSDAQGIIGGAGGSQYGDLWLTVGNVDENSNYNFTVDLAFQQWDAVR
ncbi:MAG: hypothetical protein A4E52_00553 [Pelotomaculum sp. PtaB.Bin013]|uniref:Uncharacterized protein n=1 Tax=Pelotomaculum isophthalicicum JI TaxID=947010 RepID=A0A9X4H8K0_9FIRM|nr:hypothetical protein [Pelotomaculum isophthalicicum]MDF9409004.1 hypothetical protein [Pelotomaculum isophthalicicum JI]OPX91251.1 MAG: hypothetical protein A4E52_00553 [Pelotomaculum sp. PtaB.Bin013]